MPERGFPLGLSRTNRPSECPELGLTPRHSRHLHKPFLSPHTQESTAVSMGGSNELVECFCWGAVAEGGSGAVVEFVVELCP